MIPAIPGFLQNGEESHFNAEQSGFDFRTRVLEDFPEK